MEGGGFVRDQVVKGGRHRFCISEFSKFCDIVINLIEILLIIRKWVIKRGGKQRTLSCPLKSKGKATGKMSQQRKMIDI